MYAPDARFVRHPVRIQAHGLATDERDIVLSEHSCDAIVGNPPYINAKSMRKSDKDAYHRDATQAWPQRPWTTDSDIYVYFWIHAERFLMPGGYLALLTQAGWLDVEYGIPLQKWMLDNFQIVAVLETEAEPWFTDARVATAVTILRRTTSAEERHTNVIKFVQFRRRLGEIFGNQVTEQQRQLQAENLRDTILHTTVDTTSAAMRVRVISQTDLETYGVDSDDHYVGSKWGRYLRTTESYYDLRKSKLARFAKLVDLAELDRGITTNCDSFFIVADMSLEATEKQTSDRKFREMFGVARKSVQDGRVAIVQRRDRVLLPLEREYLRPILKTARDIYEFSTSQVPSSHYAVYISGKRDEVSALARAYIAAGEREGWHRSASFVNAGDSGRDWYTLRDVDVAPILFVKTMQYTPFVFWNDGQLLANQRLYQIQPRNGVNSLALWAILNSTIFASERYSAVKSLGREAAIDVEVFTARSFSIPDIRQFRPEYISNLADMAAGILTRSAKPMLESPLETLGFEAAKAYTTQNPVQPALWPEELRDGARQEIDRLVLLGLGIPATKVVAARERLYNELVEYTRKLRLLELEAQINRRGSNSQSSQTPRQLADSIWASLIEEGELAVRAIPEDFIPAGVATRPISVPVARSVRAEGRSVLGDDKYIAKFGKVTVEFASDEEMQYAVLLGQNGISGSIQSPVDLNECRKVRDNIAEYLSQVLSNFQEHVADITNDEEMRQKIIHERLREIIKRQPG